MGMADWLPAPRREKDEGIAACDLDRPLWAAAHPG